MAEPPITFHDPVEAHRQRHELARERMIHDQVLALMRERIINCVRKEGTNARNKCKDVIKAYRDALDEDTKKQNNSTRLFPKETAAVENEH